MLAESLSKRYIDKHQSEKMIINDSIFRTFNAVFGEKRRAIAEKITRPPSNS